jgi:predicted TIM-barrel fold metal-dependent hydrolase
MQHACCHPMEQMFALMTLTVGGVLARHPGLRVVFLESGAGWLPYWLHRLDEHYEWLGAEVPDLPEPPSFYFRRQGWISTECGEPHLSHLFEALGHDRLVFATDYPHPDSQYPEAVRTFLAQPAVSPAAFRRILDENPRALYGVEDLTPRPPSLGGKGVPSSGSIP